MKIEMFLSDLIYSDVIVPKKKVYLTIDNTESELLSINLETFLDGVVLMGKENFKNELLRVLKLN